MMPASNEITYYTVNLTHRIFLGVAIISILISLALSVYWGDKRWLAIAVVVIGAAMITFCAFIVSVAGEVQLERPRAVVAFIVITIGLSGFLIPVAMLYILFR